VAVEIAASGHGDWSSKPSQRLARRLIFINKLGMCLIQSMFTTFVFTAGLYTNHTVATAQMGRGTTKGCAILEYKRSFNGGGGTRNRKQNCEFFPNEIALP
jgi:hypothetical protein